MKKHRRLILLCGVLLAISTYAIGLPAKRLLQYDPQEGDLIFQSLPKLDLVVAIEGVTESPYSHVGIVFKQGEDWYVREAIGPVKETPISLYIARGRGYDMSVYRLKEPWRKHIPATLKATKRYMGRPYDTKYRMDDAFIYCSELIYKAFKTASGEELGAIKTLGELNWKPHTVTIEKYNEGPVPMDRKMITPRHMAESNKLDLIYTSYDNKEVKP